MKRFILVAAACLVSTLVYVIWVWTLSSGVGSDEAAISPGPPYDAAVFAARRSRRNSTIPIATHPFAKSMLRVKVVRANDVLIDARVVLSRSLATSGSQRPMKETNASGVASFEDLVLGQYRAIAISDMWGSGEASISVTGKLQSVTIEVEERGVIRGRVLAWDDQPLPGVQVFIKGANARWPQSLGDVPQQYELMRMVEPGPDGYFVAAGLEPNRYFRIEARHPTHVMHPTRSLLLKPDTDPVRVYMFPPMGRIIQIRDDETGARVAIPVINSKWSFSANSENQVLKRLSYPELRLVGSRPLPGLVPQGRDMPDSELPMWFLCRISARNFADAEIAGRLEIELPGYEAWKGELELLPLPLRWKSQMIVKVRGAAGTRPVRFKAYMQGAGSLKSRTISFGVSKKKEGGRQAFAGYLRFDKEGLSSLLHLRPGKWFLDGNYGVRRSPPVVVPEGHELRTITIPFKRGGDLLVVPKNTDGSSMDHCRIVLLKGMDSNNRLWTYRNVDFGREGFELFNIPPGAYMITVKGDGPHVAKKLFRVEKDKTSSWMPVIGA